VTVTVSGTPSAGGAASRTSTAIGPDGLLRVRRGHGGIQRRSSDCARPDGRNENKHDGRSGHRVTVTSKHVRPNRRELIGRVVRVGPFVYLEQCSPAASVA